jgi:hypothetical protein
MDERKRVPGRHRPAQPAQQPAGDVDGRMVVRVVTQRRARLQAFAQRQAPAVGQRGDDGWQRFDPRPAAVADT